MGRNDVAGGVQDLLEDDELVSLGQALGVELEGHLDGAGGRLGLEGRARGRLVAVLVEERLSGALVHERAHGDVGLAGDEALVGHRVDDLGLAGLDDLVAVGGVGRLGAHLDGDVDGLALVGEVRVRRHLGSVLAKALEHDQVAAAEQARVEGDLDVLAARRERGGELGLGLHGHARGVGHGLAGRLVDEGGRELVLLAGLQPLVGDRVDDLGLGVGRDVLVAVRPVLCRGGDARALLVVKAHPHGLGHRRVAIDPEAPGDELEALVGIAAQLGHDVGAVRQGRQRVVDRRRGAVLAEREPDSCLGVHVVGPDRSLMAEQGVVGVGVPRVPVPAARGRRVAVAVRHQHVRLAGGRVLDGERDHEAGVVGLALLGDFEVVAHHLVAELERGAVRGGAHDLAAGADLEGAGLAVGQQVAPVRRRLPHVVGSVRQCVGRGLRGVGAGLVVPCGGQRGHGLARLAPFAVNEDLVRRAVRDGELDPVEAGVLARRLLVAAARERLGRLQLLVGLGHLHAAAEDLVGHGVAREVAHLVGLHGERDGGVAGVVALGRAGLDDAVIARGKRVGAGRGDVRPVLGRGLDRGAYLAVGVVLATDQHVAAGLVNDGEARAVERGVALGLRARFGVGLGDLDSARGPAEAHERLGAAAGPDAERLEPGGDLAGARLHLGEGPADQLGFRPGGELGARAVRGSRLGPRVGVGDEHVARSRVLGVVPAAAVVPAAGEHRRVEAGRAERVPDGRGHVAARHGACRVGARRGRRGRGLGAVGDVPVGAHPRGGEAAVGDLAADGHVYRARRGVGGRGRHGGEQRPRRQDERHGASEELFLQGAVFRCVHLPPPYLSTLRCARGASCSAARLAWRACSARSAR